MKKSTIWTIISFFTSITIVAVLMLVIFFGANVERVPTKITENNLSNMMAWNEIHVGGDDYQMEYSYDITPLGHTLGHVTWEVVSTYDTVETLEYTQILHRNKVYTKVKIGPFNYKILESHSEYCDCDISRG